MTIKNVLAINGSYRSHNISITYSILVHFLQGMEQAGAKTEIVNLSELKIQACRGCFGCFYRTPGECFIKDDVRSIQEKQLQADLVVYATPLYSFNMSGLLKNYLDRGIIINEPWLITSDKINGDTCNPRRFNQDKQQKIFLVSVGAYPEFNNFEALTHTFKFLAYKTDLQYLGEILRPGAEALRFYFLQERIANYYKLLKIAGEQIIKNEKIDDDIKEKLNENIFPGDAQSYRDMINEQIKTYYKKAEN